MTAERKEFTWPKGDHVVVRSHNGRLHRAVVPSGISHASPVTHPRCGAFRGPIEVVGPELPAKATTPELCRYRWCFRDEVKARGVDPHIGHVSRRALTEKRRQELVEEEERQAEDTMPRQRLPGGGWKDLGPGSAAGDAIGHAGPVGVGVKSERQSAPSSPVTVRKAEPGDHRVSCPDCTFQFVSEDALRRHRAFKHPEPVVVPIGSATAVSAGTAGPILIDATLPEPFPGAQGIADAMDRVLGAAGPEPEPEPEPALPPPSMQLYRLGSAIEREHIRFMFKLLVGEAVIRSAMAEKGSDIDDELVRVLEAGGFQLYLVPPGVSPAQVPALGAQR